MNATLRFLIMSFVLSFPAIARENNPELIYRAYSVPPSIFFAPDLRPYQKAKEIPGTGDYDVRPFLNSQGVPFPEGAEAVYSRKRKALLVRNDRASQDLVELLLGNPSGEQSGNQHMAGELIYKAYSLSDLFFTAYEGGNQKSGSWVKGAKEDPASGGLDVREIFSMQGVTFPPGSEAIYFLSTEGLLVRNTLANHDLMDVITQGCNFPGLHVQVTFSVISFRAPDTVDTDLLSYKKLREAAGDTWREIAAFSETTVWGEAIFQPPPGKSKDSQESFNLKSAKFNLVQDANGVSIQVGFHISCADKTGEFSYQGNTTVLVNTPTVLHVRTEPSSDRKTAFILKISTPTWHELSAQKHAQSNPKPSAGEADPQTIPEAN